MATREERLTQNQKLFRVANERLRERVSELDTDEAPIPFLCECADDACLGRVELAPSRYQEVREHENRYMILPDHLMVEGERVIEDNGHFHVVEKES